MLQRCGRQIIACIWQNILWQEREDENVITHRANHAAEDLADLDNGCDELQQESRHLEQTREEVVEEVHNEAFDVGTIMILISHDHEVTIP